jgi:hypothetical protein
MKKKSREDRPSLSYTDSPDFALLRRLFLFFFFLSSIDDAVEAGEGMKFLRLSFTYVRLRLFLEKFLLLGNFEINGFRILYTICSEADALFRLALAFGMYIRAQYPGTGLPRVMASYILSCFVAWCRETRSIL